MIKGKISFLVTADLTQVLIRFLTCVKGPEIENKFLWKKYELESMKTNIIDDLAHIDRCYVNKPIVPTADIMQAGLTRYELNFKRMESILDSLRDQIEGIRNDSRL